MIVKILGMVDLLTAFGIVLLKFGIAEGLIVVLAFLLIAKAFVFFGWMSIFDFLAAVIIILAFYGIFSWFTWIVFVYLLQKGFFSLLG